MVLGSRRASFEHKTVRKGGRKASFEYKTGKKEVLRASFAPPTVKRVGGREAQELDQQ